MAVKKLHDHKVLVVDDTEVNLDILVNALGEHYEVSVAMDGESALETVAEEKPDLILLDILMPGIDGYEVCRRLKADPETADIPIIFVTVQQDVANETKGFNVGAVDYITKPFSPPVVRARVRTHLALKAAQEKLKAQNEELKKTAKLREEVERMTKHDLKNPLSVILGISEMATDNKERPTGMLREMMEAIQDASLRMLRMINSSLDMFKMEEGTYTLKAQQVDIMKILQRISAETQRVNPAFKNKIKISVKPESHGTEESFQVMGEEMLLYSMLANLINNALEASPGDEDIFISLERHEDALITVRNQGEVPQQIRDNFFDKYVTWGKTKGNGLGTYIAKLITLTHGGEISLDASQKGETTLAIRLPCA